MSLSLVFVLCLCLFVGSLPASGHVFRLGECPEVEPMAGFVMDRFLGEWFVVQKFRSASDCVRENFTKVDDSYFVKRTGRPLGAPLITTISGEVFFIKNDTKAEMEVEYPLSNSGVINLKQYVVLATDYDNYALVWNCQRTLVGHRQSAQIMSREPQLDKKMVTELRELLATHQLNQHYLTIVNQKGCESDLKPTVDRPFIAIDGNVNCDKPGYGPRPGHKLDRSGFAVRLGPFHFSAFLPFKK